MARIPNPGNIRIAAKERPERLLHILVSAGKAVREEIVAALFEAGNGEWFVDFGLRQPELRDLAIEYALVR